MSRPGSVIAAIAVAVVLAGCVPQTVAETPPPGATATATPTPTATAAALPTPALNLTCADILSDGQASEILQTPVQLRVDENDLRLISDIADIQSGMLRCTWGGEGKTDNGWDQTIVLDVLPDAVSEYDSGVMQVDDGAVVYTVGDLSEYLCDYVDGNYSQCAANLLLNGYWAHVRASSGGGDIGRTVETAQKSMAGLLDRLAAVIGGAGDRTPVWTVPSGAITGGVCELPTSTRENPWSQPYPAEAYGGWRVNLSYCTWDDAGTSRSAAILPGGAWAFPQLLASPPKPGYDIDRLAPVTVPGADSALAACGPAGYCFAYLSVGGSAIAVSGEDLGMDAFIGDLSETVASIVAAG